MATKYKLCYCIQKGNMSADEIKDNLRTQGLKVANVSLYSDGLTGVIAFQKKADRDTVLVAGFLNLDETQLTVMEQDPRRGLPSPKKATASLGPVSPSLNSRAGDTHQTTSKFFNPYHFVDVNGFTPRYKVLHHDRFTTGYCGKFTVDLKFTTPGFIPDPERTVYIISNETLVREGDLETGPTIIHDMLSKWFQNKELNDDALPKEILFDPDCPGWDLEHPENHIWDTEDKPGTTAKVQKGCIRKDGQGKFIIETYKSSRWAHKVMYFFQLMGEYGVPSTSFRGMLRNTVETLSNSCFTGYGEGDDKDHMFHRLDIGISAQRNETTKLQAVVLKQNKNGKWGYVRLDQAKVLSPHLFNRIGGTGENALGAYWNCSSAYYEKISIIGKRDTNPHNCTGLHAYELPPPNGKGYRGDIHNILSDTDVKTDTFKVNEIKTVPLTHTKNEYNKTFPYVAKVPKDGQIWAIIRQLNIPTQGGGFFQSYKIKVISDDLKPLQKKLSDFNNLAKNPDSSNDKVTYAVSEIKIKTAFDIDTKTQHRAFFLFGKKKFDEAVTQKFDRNPQGFGENEKMIISQFRSLLRQRKENAKKFPPDSQGINKALAEAMPEDVYDGMLAYYHPANRYLTYTTVPQKPYGNSPRAILEKLDKLPCKRLDQLCPACQLFGTVIPRNNDAPGGSKMPSGYKGKVTVGMGKLTKPGDKDPGTITIWPLGTPKPTYYPFYVINNRRKRQQNQPPFMDYDRQDIRIGRKVYLHQEPEKLYYQTDQKTNLNATTHPVPGGTTFKFEITFENLTNYELGLLLYSLDMEYKTKEVGHYLGMGKSLGLGSCRLKLGTVTLYDMAEHYKSLEGGHGAVLKNSEVQRIELIYQYVQGTNEGEIFYQRMDNVNNGKFGDISLPDDNIIVLDYLDQKYIREFHIFKSINVQPELKLDLPVHFAGDMETEGFKWYQTARSNQSQRLFEPGALEEDAQQGNELEEHALAP